MLLVTFICLHTALAQTASTTDQQLFFSRIRVSDGLSHNKVNCIIKDQRGFVWFGTEDGLTRYDGHYFTVFNYEFGKPGALSGNIITDIVEDKDGILWISTADGGLSKYDYRQQECKQFVQFKHDPKVKHGIPDNDIRKLVLDRLGKLWLVTANKGVVRFDRSREIVDYTVPQRLDNIESAYLDNQDTLWLNADLQTRIGIHTRTLTFTQSLITTNKRTDTKASQQLLLMDQKVQNRFNNLIRSDHLMGQLEGADLSSLAIDALDRLWVGHVNSGLDIYDRNFRLQHRFRSNINILGSLVDDRINMIYIDRENIVWIGTDNGVSVFNGLFQPFKRYQLPSTKAALTIYDFYEDASRRLWIGTSDGLYVRHPQNGRHEHRKIYYKGQELAVTKFYKDLDGTFYLGTNYTLLRYDPDKNQVSPLPNTDRDPVMKKLNNSPIVSICRGVIDGKSVLLVSPYGRYLTYYDFDSKTWVSGKLVETKFSAPQGIKDSYIRKIYKDGSMLWLATNKNGLAVADGKLGNPLRYFNNETNEKDGLGSNHVFDITADNPKNLWVSTYGGGLYLFDKGSNAFRNIPFSSRLTEGLSIDKRGDIWMICNGHIHKYEPGQKVYSCYNIPALEKNYGLRGYIYRNADNVMYAAGEGYYISFNPNEVVPIQQIPPVYFTDFKIFDSSYNEFLLQDEIRLNYDQNYFSFHFAAPEFSGDNIQYAYQLVGFDKGWIEAGKINTASYANLSPGTYQFRVQAANWKGGPKLSYKSIQIVIVAPFWQTWWFVGLVVLIITAIVYFIVYQRMRVIVERRRIRNEIARDLHDQIGSTLSSIAVYANVAKIYDQKQLNEQLKSVLDHIIDSANDMVSDMNDIVWSLNPKNDNMNSIAKRWEAYALPLCQAREISFNLTIDPNAYSLHLGMMARKNLYLIVKEAINNAIKYSNCTELYVRMEMLAQGFRLTVSDNGVGFHIETSPQGDNKVQSDRNGIENMHVRAKDLQGELVIVSAPGQGTEVIINISEMGANICKKKEII